MINKIFINGRFINSDKAAIKVNDAGFLYGDGLYETVRSYKGDIFYFDSHLDRLFWSLSQLRYGLVPDKKYIKESTEELLEKNGLKNSDAYIKIIVTRNNYKEKFKFDYYSIKPSLIIIAKKLVNYPDTYYQNGIRVIKSSIQRLALGNILYRYKLLNYFENIYAKNEAYANNAQDAFFMTRDKIVLECTSANIFIVKNQKIYTPPLSLNILPGITRKIVFDISSKNNISISQKKIHYFNLFEADEIFLTSSIMEIVPVNCVDLHPMNKLQIPGKITKILMEEYRKIVKTA